MHPTAKTSLHTLASRPSYLPADPSRLPGVPRLLSVLYLTSCVLFLPFRWSRKDRTSLALLHRLRHHMLHVSFAHKGMILGIILPLTAFATTVVVMFIGQGHPNVLPPPSSAAFATTWDTTMNAANKRKRKNRRVELLAVVVPTLPQACEMELVFVVWHLFPLLVKHPHLCSVVPWWHRIQYQDVTWCRCSFNNHWTSTNKKPTDFQKLLETLYSELPSLSGSCHVLPQFMFLKVFRILYFLTILVKSWLPSLQSSLSLSLKWHMSTDVRSCLYP